MTRANDDRPTRRLLVSRLGDEYAVELRESFIMIRPKGTRRGGRAEVALPVGTAYQHGILSQMAAEKRAKRKGPRRVNRGGLGR